MRLSLQSPSNPSVHLNTPAPSPKHAQRPVPAREPQRGQAKKLAQVIGNPTCLKILDYLAGKDATETQVGEEDLKIPLSTVHYNLQQLVGAKLVVIEEFHYSPKGREVNHYKLADKFIIIAPKDDDPSFLARLKNLVPAAVVTLGLATVLKSMEFFTGTLPGLRRRS